MLVKSFFIGFTSSEAADHYRSVGCQRGLLARPTFQALQYLNM